MKPRHGALGRDSRRNTSSTVAQAPHKDVDNNKQKRKATTYPLQRPEGVKALGPASASLSTQKQNNQKAHRATSLQDVVKCSRYDSVKSRDSSLVLASGGVSSTSCSVSSNRLREAKFKKQDTLLLPPRIMEDEHSVADALHQDILAYRSYTKKTVDKMTVHIEQMIAKVRASVQSLWPQAKVETFGSYSTGIWLPSSDVDLVILDVVEVNDAILTAKHLRELSKVLERKEWVDSVLCLDSAKMPVLKLVSAKTSVPIDITFESAATHSGLLARDLIKSYADLMPELYPLAIVIKQLLRERDLNDVYTGGLSSYSVVLMIIHFLQLWRNGELCFEAASIYASGSLPPAPANMQGLKATRIRSGPASLSGNSKPGDKLTSIESQTQRSETSTVGLQKKAAAFPAPSYAAIVGKQAAKHNPLSETRLSYAAVAAGVTKGSNSYKPAEPPSSYAAAVSSPARSVFPIAKGTRVNQQKMQTQLDSISESSSNADTEDSCSSCSHSSSADSDDEVQPQPKSLPSLGQHLMMFFEFFGIIFDYRTNGLSVRDGGYIYRLADHHRPHIGKPALVIEDPIHPDRNVCASSFAFSKVVTLFEDSYYALKYFRTSKFTPSALSSLLSASHPSSYTSNNKVHSAR